MHIKRSKILNLKLSYEMKSFFDHNKISHFMIFIRKLFVWDPTTLQESHF